MKIGSMMPSKYLKKDDVPSPVLVTIRNFSQANVAQEGQPEEKKWIMHIDEFENGIVMNSTNLQLCAQALGSDDTDDWLGQQVVLYNDPNVTFGGKLTGGIRIRAVRRKVETPPAAVRSSVAKPAPVPFDDMEDDPPF